MDLSVGEVHLPGRRLFTGITRDISDRKAVEAEAQLEDLALAVVEGGEEAPRLARVVPSEGAVLLGHEGEGGVFAQASAEAPGACRIGVEPPYEQAKAVLLDMDLAIAGVQPDLMNLGPAS